MRWDTGLPTGATLQSASLEVVPAGDAGPGTSIKPAASDWSTSTTWGTRPRLKAAIGTVDLTQGSRTSIDLTTTMTSWISKPATNFGLALTPGAAVQRSTLIRSSKDADPDARPYLRLRYSVTDRGTPIVGVADLDDLYGPLAGRITVPVSAGDDAGVKSVLVQVDGVTIGKDDRVPFTVPWDTATVPDGRHTVTAVAYDFAGRSASATTSVEVANETVRPLDRLDADLASGAITADQYGEYATYAAFAPTFLPTRYAGAASEHSEDLMHKAILVQDQMTPNGAQAVSDFVRKASEGWFDGPPPTTAPGGATAPAARTAASTSSTTIAYPNLCRVETHQYKDVLYTTYPCVYRSPNGRFEMWFTIGGSAGVSDLDNRGDSELQAANGVPDHVDEVVDRLDQAYDTYVSTLGYRPPELPVTVKIGQIGNGISPPFGAQWALSDGADIFMSNVSNDYGKSYLPRHELFHVMQWRYAGIDDYLDIPASGFIVFLESSANWAADLSYGSQAHHDSTQWADIPDLLGEPGNAMYNINDDREYGGVLFPTYIAERYSPAAVRRVWENIGSDMLTYPAIEQMLRERGGSMPSFLRAYWVANYVINEQAGHPGVGYTNHDVGTWRTILDGDPKTRGSFPSSVARPARTMEGLRDNATVSGSASVGPGGAAFVDLVPASADGGRLQVELTRPWPRTEMRGAVVAFGQYPSLCTAPRYLDFDDPADDSTDTVDFFLPAGCTFATLVLSHGNQVLLDRDVDWRATWTPVAPISVSSIPDAVVSVPYDTTLTIYGGQGRHSVRVLSGAIPGLTVGSDGHITGTPQGPPAEGIIRLEITDEVGSVVEQDVAWRITSLPVVDPDVVPVGGSTPPPCVTCGGSWGDPHLTTFDGLSYDEQAAGELTLVRGPGLEVQARQVPWRNSAYVSVNTAFALDVAGDRVGAYLTADGVRTVVNGATADLSGGPLRLPDGGTVSLDQGGRSWVATWPDGSTVALDVWPGEALHARVGLADARRGNVVGLLGDADGDRSDDWRTSDGTLVPIGSTGSPFRGYLDSWRVSDETSLFDYDAGESTVTWTDLRFPGRPLELADLPSDQVTAAREVCRSAGIVDQPALDSCALDVALIGPAGANGAMFAAWTGSADSIVRDGGFEEPALGGGYQTFTSGKMGAWTVGDVDLVRDWNDAEGQQSVDMSSCAAGWLSQDLPTVAGRRYVVRYALSANPGGPSVKTLRVEIDGASVQRRDVTSTSPLTWNPQQVEFIAAGALTTLTFRSETGGCYGPALDAVAVVPAGG